MTHIIPWSLAIVAMLQAAAGAQQDVPSAHVAISLGDGRTNSDITLKRGTMEAAPEADVPPATPEGPASIANGRRGRKAGLLLPAVQKARARERRSGAARDD